MIAGGTMMNALEAGIDKYNPENAQAMRVIMLGHSFELLKESQKFINGYCRAKNIDPEAPEITGLFREKEAAWKAEQKEAQDKKAVETLMENLDSYKTNLDGGRRSQDQDMITRYTEISKIFATLGTPVGRVGNLFLSFDAYKAGIASRKDWEEYAPKLFNWLSFPDGTLSAIGAAPGSGKSAALVNLARELLVTKPTNNPNPRGIELQQNKNAQRKILILSAEMTADDIADRLAHAIAWQTADDAIRENLASVDHTNTDYWKAARTIAGKSQDWDTFTKEERERQEHYREVWETYLHPNLGDRLKIAYIRGFRTFNEITNLIRSNADPGTLVLMDYLQLLPPTDADLGADGNGTTCPRYLQIRHTIDQAILAAEDTKSIIITAAQLGREIRKEGSKAVTDDTQGWRESGDIEQSGWNLIKLFMEYPEDDPGNKTLSYRVSKCRSSGKVGERYVLEWVPGYQYMAWTGEQKKRIPKRQKRSREQEPEQDGYTIED
jgi:hypothetical protein